MRNALSAIGLLLAMPLAHAADASLALSNKTFAADVTSQEIGKGLEVTAGFLHHSDNGNLGSVGLQVSQKVNANLDASLGGKLVFIHNDTKNAAALALGGVVDMAVPQVPQLHLGLHLWYAPTVTSFNGADNYHDVGTSVSYRVLSNAEVFAAYRRVRVDYEREGGKTIHSGPLFGMKLFF